ncbi:hypothetical protein EDC04DRAFT_2605329 [Pisolithus marmoratus]|nr:hypothetical protein EDC04DRAFT_2605329 [Pisolithus marmoratus]
MWQKHMYHDDPLLGRSVTQARCRKKKRDTGVEEGCGEEDARTEVPVDDVEGENKSWDLDGVGGDCRIIGDISKGLRSISTAVLHECRLDTLPRSRLHQKCNTPPPSLRLMLYIEGCTLILRSTVGVPGGRNKPVYGPSRIEGVSWQKVLRTTFELDRCQRPTEDQGRGGRQLSPENLLERAFKNVRSSREYLEERHSITDGYMATYDGRSAQRYIELYAA